jgi:hypothetical protein
VNALLVAKEVFAELDKNKDSMWNTVGK